MNEDTTAATAAPTNPKDGQVVGINWNGVPADLVPDPTDPQPDPKKKRKGFSASGVLDPGVYSATYTWDGTSTTLHLDKPKKLVPGDGSTTMAGVNITHLKIDGWGEADLVTPVDWDGATSGTLYITFEPSGTSQSGPIGTVNGP
ncbi:MAG TPA: hypothetical protein VGY57_12150 [Vicinamibacterales bacterium]|jgi:hypothetical protein|nr:hypothetical protein [Vicinamibacterales bacterium]